VKNFTIRRQLLTLPAACVALAFIPAVAAQSNGWSIIVEAAKKEGEVIVWGQAGEHLRRFWKDGFERDNPGITVRLFQAPNSSERDTRFLREFESGVLKVDVLVAGSGGIVSRLKPAKAIQPLKPFLQPDILDGKNWVGGNPVWVDNDREYVLIGDLVAGAAAVTNMSIGETELKSWDDLLNPRFDGKIISLDPRQSGQAFAFSLFLYASPDLGPAYLEKFFKGGRVIFTSDQRQTIEWVESGRMQIGFGVREPEIAAMLEVGGKIRVFPTLLAEGKPQTIVNGSDSSLAIPNLTPLPHPNAARVFANWLFSKQGQQAMVDLDGQYSIRTDVDTSKLPDRVKQRSGVTYSNMNNERYVDAGVVKAMRDLVTKAVNDR
jgi:iron(III) transport system substrate-binding protein